MSFNFQCPYCATTLEAEDDWIGMDAQCPQCRKNIFIIKQPISNNSPAATPVAMPTETPVAMPTATPVAMPTATPVAMPTATPVPVATAIQEPRNANNNMVVYQVAEGKFNITGDYSSVWEIVLQTMAECQVTVKEQNLQSGSIVGSCKYGINQFGMTVLAFVNNTGSMINLEFNVQLADAFDTVGACRKKVQMLSAKFINLCPINSVNMPNMQYNNAMQNGIPNNNPQPQMNNPQSQMNNPQPQMNNPQPQQNYGQAGMNVPPNQQGYKQSYGAMPMGFQGINVSGSNWYVDYNEAQLVQKQYTIMWILIAASILTLGLSAIAGLVFSYILLYKFWKFIPYQESYHIATPAKAVGFCFIPLFNFYWIFVAYHKLATFYQRYTSKPIGTYALIMCINLIVSCAFIPVISLIASIVDIVFFFLLFNELKNIVVALGNNSLNNGSPRYGR